MNDFYTFDDEQLAAIARVECLRKMREVKRGWRDYSASHPAGICDDVAPYYTDRKEIGHDEH